MEKSIRENDVHPLRYELQAHKTSTILELVAIAVAAFLNVGSRGAVNGDPTDTPVLYLFAIAIAVISGIILTRETFADTYQVTARDAQYAIPVNARTRYFAKLASILLRHIAAIILVNAVFIGACAVLNVCAGTEIVDIKYSVIQASDILGFCLGADCLTVITMACTGTVAAQVIFGFGIGSVAGFYWIYAVALEFVDSLFGFEGAFECNGLIVWCVIAPLILTIAGGVYIRRDGRHTGKFIAGRAAWEVLTACVILFMEPSFTLSEYTWLVMISLLVGFFAVHYLLFREKARKELPFAIAVYITITLLFLAFVLFRYASTRGKFYSKDRNALESGEYWIDNEDWNNEWWRNARRYANEPDCELMIGSRILSWIDSRSSDEYHITNADGSLLNEEQYAKLVGVLRDFCENNEIRKDSFGDVLAFIFCGADSNYEGIELGFQVTASFGEGRNAHRERCAGYILYEDRVPDFLKKIEDAGFVVQRAINTRR